MQTKPWLQHYDEGVPHNLDYPEITLVDLLERPAADYPNAPCTLFNGAVISYGEMNAFADRLAAGLARLGIKAGDRVGIFMPNTPQFIMSYFAVLKLGAAVVAINPLYTANEIDIQVNNAGVEIMILMSNNYEKVKALQARTRIRQLVATNIKETLPAHQRLLFSWFREKNLGFRVELRDQDIWLTDLIADLRLEEAPQVNIQPEDTALLQYSGGSTGISKGVVASHRNLVVNAAQIDAWNVTAVEGRERVLLALPLYHAYGMAVGMLYGLMKRAALIMVPDPREVGSLLRTIQKYKPTIFPGVPALYNAINHHPDVEAGKYDLSSVKVCISGSAPLLSRTKLRFEQLTGGTLVEGYGLSEALVVTHCNPINGLNKPGAIGLPFPDVECRVVDLEDGVTVLGQGEVGELVLRAPQVMRQYHRMPQETMAALKEGWLYTGDIARMDEDGYFFLSGRKKDVIKVGGFQVWPREVEEVIQTHADVLDVAVGGVAGGEEGEQVKAWVVLAEGALASPAEIQAWCREQLVAYKVPRQIEFLDELPKNNVGKVLREALH
ncbi:MAG: long-chain fatty acid--CoA ligase [Chloroflexi bacterium]|nr:long-chain fatty acid--CoA ligase [Chloroflexota bacterium]MQC27151.1 long-chain fatty acid--CoA ligase [Chloroflexota bacterium]